MPYRRRDVAYARGFLVRGCREHVPEHFDQIRQHIECLRLRVRTSDRRALRLTRFTRQTINRVFHKYVPRAAAHERPFLHSLSRRSPAAPASSCCLCLRGSAAVMVPCPLFTKEDKSTTVSPVYKEHIKRYDWSIGFLGAPSVQRSILLVSFTFHPLLPCHSWARLLVFTCKMSCSWLRRSSLQRPHAREASRQATLLHHWTRVHRLTSQQHFVQGPQKAALLQSNGVGREPDPDRDLQTQDHLVHIGPQRAHRRKP